VPSLREVGEFEVIRRLVHGRVSASAPPVGAGEADTSGIVLGSGDDAAVVRPTPLHDLVVTTDAFVEGRHYTDQFEPARVGARLAVANLSDLAAMAARPRWALISIGARPEREVDDLVRLEEGMAERLKAEDVAIVGGNLVAVEGAEWQSLTLIGEALRGKIWSRSAARAGDLIAVTGFPGRAGAGARLVSIDPAAMREPSWARLLDAWLEPRARVAFARALAEGGGVRAAIDLSDGFAADLGHLCEASAVGAEIEEARWPSDPLLERAAEAFHLPPLALAFGPSDDYELILAVDPSSRDACEEVARTMDVRLSFVGRIADAKAGIVRVTSSGRREKLSASGYDHFAAPSGTRPSKG
jgi:thiamine-monophosphate kinase